MAKKTRPTDALIADALRANHGQYYSTAKALGVCQATLKKWLKPEHVAIHDDFYEQTTDLAEQQIHVAVARGEPRAMEFWLRNQGKKRGWTEKQDISIDANVQVHDVAKRRAAIAAVLGRAAGKAAKAEAEAERG